MALGAGFLAHEMSRKTAETVRAADEKLILDDEANTG
jgi:hypothetical protein